MSESKTPNKFLLDTHVLLWYLNNDERLSIYYQETIQNLKNEIYVSSMSLWEIAIKISLEKLDFTYSLTELEQFIKMQQFTLLPINPNTLDTLTKLPYFHRDPFDRYLIAEAKTLDLELISDDL
jgi:PIN domain nuclease of toxin-antitoxin system